MKVVWLIQNLVPYHHARYEAFAQQAGVEAHLVQVTDKDGFSVLEFKPEQQDYRLHTLFPGRARASIASGELGRELDRVLGSIRPDVVCVSGWGMVIGQRLLAWAAKNRVPAVMFSESTEFDEQRDFKREWIKSRLVRSAAAALVGGRPHREYVEKLGMDPEAVFDGHNAVDSSHFSAVAAERPGELPAILEEAPYFAVCTRFGEKKNLPRLVRAYAKYVSLCRESEVDPIRLAMGGNGETRALIEDVIRDNGLQSSVLMLGLLTYNALPWFYQNSAAFIHASTTEQWGLVVNEAMAAGAPLLISKRCGCAEDLLADGVNGFGFNPYDEEAIAETIFRFTQLGKEAKKTMGRSSIERIQAWGPSRFSENLMAAVEHARSKGCANPNGIARLILHMLNR